MRVEGMGSTQHCWKRIPRSLIYPWMLQQANEKGPLAEQETSRLLCKFKVHDMDEVERILAEKLPGWIAEDAAIRETLAPLPE